MQIRPQKPDQIRREKRDFLLSLQVQVSFRPLSSSLRSLSIHPTQPLAKQLYPSPLLLSLCTYFSNPIHSASSSSFPFPFVPSSPLTTTMLSSPPLPSSPFPQPACIFSHRRLCHGTKKTLHPFYFFIKGYLIELNCFLYLIKYFCVQGVFACGRRESKR